MFKILILWYLLIEAFNYKGKVMSDISINGTNYEINSKGPINVKEVKSVDEVKQDFKDDIVVKNKDNKLLSISADELDIKSKNMFKPYVGLPNKGDQISFFGDNKKVEGKVVASNDENDAVTFYTAPVERVVEKDKQITEERKNYQPENPNSFTNTIVNATNKAIDKTIEVSKDVTEAVKEAITPPPKTTGEKIGEAIDNTIEKTEEIFNPNPTPFEKVEKTIDKIINPNPTPMDKIKNSIDNATNQTGHVIRDVIKEATGETLTVGQVETVQKGNFDFGVNLSKNPTLNASYTVGVTKLDEELHPLGGGLLNEPNSEVYFLSHSVGAKVGPSEISVGYKAGLGVEFNRPFKNDFSFSAVAMTDVGVRPGGGAFLGLGMGLEGRYQLDKNMSIYGGPVARGTLVGDPGKGKGVGLEAGLNVKF